jgi:hypothetical protein
MNRHIRKLFFYFLGRLFYKVRLYDKATFYYSEALRFRFFFLDIQERYLQSIIKSKEENFYVIKGGIGDILQYLPFVLENKKLHYVVLTYFKDARNFFVSLGVKNCKFIYYESREDYSKYNKLLNTQKNTYQCPRSIFFKSHPFGGIKKILFDNKRKTIGLHFNSSQMNQINTFPIGLQTKLIKMLIKDKFNLIVFSSKNEFKKMKIIKSRFIKYSHDLDLIKNLARVNNCDIFIGSDSAFKTMSSMLKIPTIVIIPNDQTSSFTKRMFFEPYTKKNILSIFLLKVTNNKKMNNLLISIQKKISDIFSHINYYNEI